MHLVDTHQHLWDIEQFPYSWCREIAALNRPFRLEDYAAAADGLGITKTIFMECDVDLPHALAEARHVQALADAHPLIAGIVASGRPESGGFRDHVEELMRLPKLRGLRRVLHTQPDGLSAQSRFVENVQLLAEFGLTFDVCVLARQLPQAIALLEACPKVSFVLDHCGVPDVKARAFDPWRTHLTQIAALPNVVCKVSGLVAYADPATWTVAELQPWFDHVIASFGWDRVVWGGDWPVCTLAATLQQWVEATQLLAKAATAEQRAGLFYRNAERIYRV